MNRSVTGRYSEHASNFAVANAFLSISAVLAALSAGADQGRSHGVDETVAARDKKHQRRGRWARSPSYGDTGAAVAGTTGQRPVIKK